MQLVVTRNRARGFVPIAGNLMVPGCYTVAVDDPACPYRVELDVEVDRGSQPRCVQLRTFQRDEGSPVTGEGLRRVKVTEYVRSSVLAAAMRITETREGTVWMEPVGEDDDPDPFTTWRRTGGRGRGRLTGDELVQVASIYREAVKLNKPPTETVKKVLNLSRSTAGRQVMEARRRGFLEPAKPRQRGKLTRSDTARLQAQTINASSFSDADSDQDEQEAKKR